MADDLDAVVAALHQLPPREQFRYRGSLLCKHMRAILKERKKAVLRELAVHVRDRIEDHNGNPSALARSPTEPWEVVAPDLRAPARQPNSSVRGSDGQSGPEVQGRLCARRPRGNVASGPRCPTC